MSEKAPFDINDMGLNIGDIEDNDFCRGFGFNTNENEDGYFENVESNDHVIEEINDKAPEMPQEFYHNLDNFLTRAPPKLTESSGLKKKGKAKSTKDTAPMFPTIIQKGEQYNSPPMPPSERPPVKTKTKSTKDKNSGTGVKKLGTHIDPSLLSEAFEYTDRLLKEAVIEEAQQQRDLLQQQNSVSQGHTSHSGYAPVHRDDNVENLHSQQQQTRHVKSAPESIYGTSSSGQQQRSNSVKEGGNSVSAIRRLKSNKQTSGGGAGGTQKSSSSSSSSSNLNTGFNTATDGEGDSRRHALDFDELVANFQSGATLQRLRRELEQSQASMASSQSYLRNLSKDYFR